MSNKIPNSWVAGEPGEQVPVCFHLSWARLRWLPLCPRESSIWMALPQNFISSESFYLSLRWFSTSLWSTSSAENFGQSMMSWCSLCYVFQKSTEEKTISSLFICVTALGTWLHSFAFSEMISCSGMFMRPLPRFSPSPGSLSFPLLSPPTPPQLAVSPFCISATNQRRIGKRVRNVPEFKRKAMEKVEKRSQSTFNNAFPRVLGGSNHLWWWPLH